MAKLVCMGAMMQCSFGMTPAPLTVPPLNRVSSSFMPDATVMDYKPMMNIPPFGMCNAPTNPAVMMATTAAGGTPTPAPCVPATTSPWAPGSLTVKIGSVPALNNSSKLMCTWLGVISITMPGQLTVNVP